MPTSGNMMVADKIQRRHRRREEVCHVMDRIGEIAAMALGPASNLLPEESRTVGTLPTEACRALISTRNVVSAVRPRITPRALLWVPVPVPLPSVILITSQADLSAGTCVVHAGGRKRAQAPDLEVVMEDTTAMHADIVVAAQQRHRYNAHGVGAKFAPLHRLRAVGSRILSCRTSPVIAATAAAAAAATIMRPCKVPSYPPIPCGSSNSSAVGGKKRGVNNG